MSIVLSVLVAVPVGIALLHQGFPSADIDMQARDVWVTNSDEAIAGRLNAQIQELDGSVALSGDDVLVHQDGDAVFLHDRGSGTLGRVDPNYTNLRESILTPPSSVSAYGNGVLAILDPATGRVWVVDARTALSFDASQQDPVLELGAGAQVVVTTLGTVLATSRDDGSLYRIAGVGQAPVHTTLGRLDDFELTAVGERAAVLDRTNNTVVFEGGTTVALTDVGVRIQQPGPEADAVLVAAPTGLLQVPFGGDVVALAPEIVAGGRDPGSVAAPVNLRGCAYGAWSAPKTLTIACEGSAPETHEIAQRIEGQIMFRVNRDVIVLNDLRSGNVWLPHEDMRLVENWQDTVPPEDTEGEDGENEATEQSFEDTLAERTDENHPPELKDDRFGVRPGRAAYLPVLDNDTDPDGDLITITELKGEVPEGLGELRVVDEGRALQFVANERAAGEFTIPYVGSDGREGGVAEAQLTVEVVPGTVENRAPVSHHVTTLTVEAGQKITYNVLGDWVDPDGDPVYLLAASSPSGTSTAVSTTPDGRITVTAVGAELGARTVTYVVSDGVAQTTGELTVEVSAPQSLAPIGTPDYARGLAGTTVTVDPLINDLSPSGAPLSVVEISELDGGAGGAAFSADLGTVTYQTTTPGTYYVQYTVSAGGRDSIGLIRFDILDPKDVEPGITAVADVGYLRPYQPTSIAVLTNDMSSGDAVLSVQEVTTTDEARVLGIAIELLENSIVRVTSQVALLEPIEVPYTITDGERTSTSTITLVPVEPVVTHQPPLAVDDVRKVRVGDFTSVDVLANDIHPDDIAMTVSTELTDLDIGEGVAFVTGNQVRFQAPNTPGTYSLTYIVTDEFGEQGGARIAFQVVADDEASNRPPRPVDETARVFEGASILVQVPLTGVDPDGDSVTFTGIVGSTQLGTVRDANQTSFVYEAFPGAAGTDTVTYEVVDTYGQRAEGRILIGVVPRGEQLLPPVAVDDTVYARPGSTIAVPVLENDSDPNGFTIELVPEFPDVDPALEAEVDGDAVLLTLPVDEQFVSVPYSITNGHGGTANGWITVELTEEAPVFPPTATDQVVPQTSFDGATYADVDVRIGARNPTGRLGDLVVGLTGTNASSAEVLADGKVRVTPTDRRQVIAFTLTSPDTDLQATAFIMVPAVVTEESKRQSPYLRTDLREQTTPVGAAMSWDVNDLVVAPSGNRVIAIDAANAWAEQSDGSPVVVSESRVQFVPKPGYRGPASITFMVSDATGPDDTNAGVATIRIRITVGDPEFRDTPPTFITPQITVEVGTSRTFDLTTATGHPNPALIPEVRYSNLTGSTGKVSGSLSGSTLSLEAALDTEPGTIVPMQVTYTFAEFTQTGTINVTVVSSSKPPPRAVADSLASRRGEIVMMDVTSNDFNPYPEAPLRLIEAIEESSTSTGAQVSVVGNQIRIEPASSFIGEITVRYKMGDGTYDPLRETYGYATLRVRDVPSAPASVTLAAAGPSRVTGQWELANSNGEPISGYEAILTPSGAGAPITVQLGVASSHTFTAADGIVAGTAYTMQVRAQNVLGWGPLSASSPSVTPLDKPGAPQNVSVSNGVTSPGETKGSLKVTWEPPLQTGGELTEYQVSIVSPESAKKTWTVDAGKRSFDLDGLTVPKNGSTEFAVTVTAVNTQGSSTSNPSSGTLTYQAKPEIDLSVGGLREIKDDKDYYYAFHVDGSAFLDNEIYEIECFTGSSLFNATRMGTFEHPGWKINEGMDLEPNVKAGERFFVILWLNGEKVAESSVVKA